MAQGATRPSVQAGVTGLVALSIIVTGNLLVSGSQSPERLDSCTTPGAPVEQLPATTQLFNVKTSQVARIELFRGSCVTSARPSASKRGGRYIANRPR